MKHREPLASHAYISAFLGALCALHGLLVLTGCAPPTQQDPARFGTVRVAFASSADGVYAWRADQLDQLAPLFTELDAIGPDFVQASEAEADVLVRAASLGGPCGAFTTGRTYVEADTACAQGYLALRRAVSHELVHYYTWTRWHWAGHVCDWPLGAAVPTGCHPTIRCSGDDCLMSRGLAAPDDGPTFSEVYTGAYSSPEPQQPDIDLIAHCQTTGACTP